MFVRNLGGHSTAELQYLGLKRDSKYLFPHAVKYVTWFIVFAVIITSSVILIYYGMSFGMMKTYLWLTSIVTAFLIGVFITAPIRIFLLSLFGAIFFKAKPALVRKRIIPSLLENPEDPAKKKIIENTRRYNKHLYTPTPVSKLQTRLEDIKYNIELRNIAVDVAVYILFILTVCYVVLINKTEMGYHSTETIKNLVVNASYTNSIPFTEVRTYETLLEYLNDTLLPALLLDYKDYAKIRSFFYSNLIPDISNKRRRRSQELIRATNISSTREMLSWYKEVQADLTDSNSTNVFEKGWTMDPAVKLIGKPRLRQIRVTTDSCKEIITLEGRNLKCAEELTLLNVETGEFTLKWAPHFPKGLTVAEKTPWVYQNGWETRTLPVFAKFSYYPAGGYVLDLARNIKDARIVLQYLDTFQWVDVRTRVVFVEFTTYCVNANLFNVVTLIAEKSASGYIIPSYQIVTCKLMFMLVEVEIFSVIMSVLFALLLFFLLLREGLRIHRTSFKLYAQRAFAMLDLAVIFIGAASVLSIILRSIYVSYLLEKLEDSDNNEFVSFSYVAFWDRCSIYIEAILVCLAAFKIFHLLTFRVLFFQLQTTLIQCYKHFIDLLLQIFILMVAFALFFYLTVQIYSYGFSSFVLSLSTMIGRSVAMDDTFDFGVLNTSPLLPIFFGLFVVFISILFVNVFIAVICLYFHKTRLVSLTNKYNITRYLKHILAGSKRNDILHMKGKKNMGETTSVLRLKGGGSKASKKGKKEEVRIRTHKEEKEKKRKANKEKRHKREENNEIKRKNKRKNEREGKMEKEEKKKRKKDMKTKCLKRKEDKEGEEETANIDQGDFVVKKPYEMTEYMDLGVGIDKSMRFLTTSILAENEEKRQKAREVALKAIFVTRTWGRKMMAEVNSSDRYFIVVTATGKRAFKESKLLEMKKVAEDFAREKGWMAEEDSAPASPNNFYDTVRILNEKLGLLLLSTK